MRRFSNSHQILVIHFVAFRGHQRGSKPSYIPDCTMAFPERETPEFKVYQIDDPQSTGHEVSLNFHFLKMFSLKLVLSVVWLRSVPESYGPSDRRKHSSS